jgi:DNA modification methylase
MSNVEDHVETLINEFEAIIEDDFKIDEYALNELRKMLNSISCQRMDKALRKDRLIEAINKKFNLNKQRIKTFIDFVALDEIYFNFHEKKKIEKAFNSSDKNELVDLLKSFERKIREKYLLLFLPLTNEETLNWLRSELKSNVKSYQIKSALFSSFAFYSFPIEYSHNYFSDGKSSIEDYKIEYNNFLETHFSDSLVRKKALQYLVINEKLYSDYNNYHEFRDHLFAFIEDSYLNLSNHCYLAVSIKLPENLKGFKWNIFSDILLYGEKFQEESLRIGYFHPEKIKKRTLDYIEEIDEEKVNFSSANTGFTYKDCFIITQNDIRDKKEEELNDNYALLILLEKNHRDESVIPCPSCRSEKVRGNSYPILGVKSWECKNEFCPDKSKYNRGKRYSLSSIIKQRAILDEGNNIATRSIRKWQLDVLQANDEEIIDFLITHYSLVSDRVEFFGVDFDSNVYKGRNISHLKFPNTNSSKYSQFYSSNFFNRFRVKKNKFLKTDHKPIFDTNSIKVFHSESTSLLNAFDEGSIDYAVTSPPYYNAKEYASWENIYCYLYDMYNNARMVYKSLKPGGVYLYNIFDYFDNENNIVFSAMGKKRLILGAYIIHLFEHAGFKLSQNVIWYKGHIQGNRSFNQGNNFPYYQSPLNCYEHIFAFVKGDQSDMEFPDILNSKPVHKMVKGKNILGHTAPFPKSIPKLVVSRMKEGEIVVDPYAGSFTTCLTAIDFDKNSIGIELNSDYSNLGVQLIKQMLKATKN